MCNPTAHRIMHCAKFACVILSCCVIGTTLLLQANLYCMLKDKELLQTRAAEEEIIQSQRLNQIPPPGLVKTNHTSKLRDADIHTKYKYDRCHRSTSSGKISVITNHLFHNISGRKCASERHRSQICTLKVSEKLIRVYVCHAAGNSDNSL